MILLAERMWVKMMISIEVDTMINVSYEIYIKQKKNIECKTIFSIFVSIFSIIW